MGLHLRSSAMRVLRPLLAAAVVVLASPALAHAAVYPCTDAGLTAALAAGGTATFSCTAPTTIVVSAPRTITVSGTDLDGGGLLILSGGGVRRPLAVAAGVTAQVRNVTLENGAGNTYGGCLAVSGTLTMTDSTIRNCSATGGGSGAQVAGGGLLRMDRCTLSGNTGGVEGAVAVHGTAVLTNTTLSGNSHRGVYTRFGGTATIDQCTIVTTVGEPVLVSGVGETVALTHSILWGPAGQPSVAGAGTLVSQGYNLLSGPAAVTVGGDTTGNQIGVSPLLGPLADNGGPTQTRALLDCSPGINAGATYGSASPTDQRGQSRFSGSARDIGAFESTLSPCVSIEDVTGREGDALSSPFSFTVRLSGAASSTTRVDFVSADGTATASDGDFTFASGTLQFAPGTTTATVSLAVVGDRRFEPDETVLVNLRSPTNLTIADAQGVGTILNDDRQPTVSVADVRVAEGGPGSRTMSFVVSLSETSAQTVTVDIATADETATVAGGDYTAASATLSFAPGVRTRTFDVTFSGDTQFETDEVFAVLLSSPVNATLATSRATGTIANDDGVPTLAIGDVRVVEGAGVSTALFTVALSSPSGLATTVGYATADDTAAVADGDYVSSAGTLTFVPGVVAQTVAVIVVGDRTFEPDETFRVELAAAAGATIADGSAVGTIANDDALPVVDVADARTSEGDSGTSTLTFAVALANPSAAPVTVTYATQDDTATIADDDYDPASGTVTFAPGVTHAAVDVAVRGDVRFEPEESLRLVLASPTGASLGDATGAGVVTNDDGPPSLAVGDLSVAEGSSGTTEAAFTVRLDAPSAAPVTVAYATADGTATSGDDYASTSGTLTFAPGVVSQTLPVTVTGDDLFEGDETFRVELSAPTGATIGDATGWGTIRDDEARPGLAVGAASIVEGDAGGAGVDLTVTLSGASERWVTVGWATVDGTATAADRDYASAMGTLTFAPGATSQSLRVDVFGDARFEDDETFSVHLSSAAGAAIATADGTITITNDDRETPIVDGGMDLDAGTLADAGADAAAAVDAGAATDGGAMGDADHGGGADGGTIGAASGGCGCVVGARAPSTSAGALSLLLALALLARRRGPRHGARPAPASTRSGPAA